MKFILILLSIIFFQDDLIKVSSSVDKNIITIGDKIHYKIRIEYDRTLEIQTPGQGINLGYFEVKDYKIHTPRKEGHRTIEEYEYTISTYDTGKYVIPPFPVGYFVKGDKKTFSVIEAAEQPLEVQSLFLNDSTVKKEPRTIKGPLNIPYKSVWWIWTLSIAIFLGILYSIYRFFFQKKKDTEIETKKLLRAHEIALQKLEKEKGFSSIVPQEVNGYYTRLSYILREYLENRFNTPAIEETTTELRNSLKNIPLSEKEYDKLIELIETSDLVKFAKDIPTQNKFETIFNDIEAFVIQTKEKELQVQKVT